MLKRLWFRLNIELWNLGEVTKKIARVPLVDKTIGPFLWNEKNLDSTYLPVGEAVDTGKSSVLPVSIIEKLLSMSEHIFILSRCPCRTAGKCENFPRSHGCLFLGPATREIAPGLGKFVGRGEAIEHVLRGLEIGLLPNVVHGSFDASLLRIDYRRMLAVCFCCNCCCAFRKGMKDGPESYRDRILRLPGVSMRGRSECAGCGTCESVCFIGAVKVTPDGPSFADFCKCCGKCALECPYENIELVVDPLLDPGRELLERLGRRTSIG